MPPEDDFIQNIVANPDDDTPRLVFADWLDEQGDCARAEFIRVQCELARIDKGKLRYRKLRERELELHRKHGWRWWHDAFDPEVHNSTFQRGFLAGFLTQEFGLWSTLRVPSDSSR